MKHLTKDELTGLVAVAEKHDPTFALMILVIFNHGLRISEALALTVENFVDGFIVVQRLKGARHRGGLMPFTPRNDQQLNERARRITALIEKPRMMTPRAAATVVDAAMFGVGCIEGDVRKQIQARLDKESN